MTIDANTPHVETVLVTGGRGFIGSHLVSLLCEQGYRVVSVDIANGNLSAHPRSIQLDADIRDVRKMEEVFSQYDFSCVFDLASYTEVGLTMDEYQCNVDQTHAMVRLVRNYSTPKYIFYSTQFVHRVKGQAPKNEVDYKPTECYGASKVISEKYIRENLPEEQWLILRPSYIWGPGLERFRDGLLYRLAKKQFLITSDKKFKRYYGYVETIAAQTIAFSKMPFSALPHKVYYISDASLSMNTFCSHLAAALGVGGAWYAPSFVIQCLGLAGEIMGKVSLPRPINSMQARELTTNFPIPIQRTIEATGCSTDYSLAARKMIEWACQDEDFCQKIGAKAI
ncbi:NAD-dependent epimerase/dehydratase family protein [Desulfogranum japonicum]|uniref:NAD-dependent epimerase/dehydratase family protein n=1 Tax=Desulfogranum japonicum TaxID=231447 RepID=UPI00041C3359|nr:NAD(P)-dependent oxidoreductase [Desulfogranum japonicum]